MKRTVTIFVMILLLATGCTMDNAKGGMRQFAQAQNEVKRSQIPIVLVDGQEVPVLRGERRPEQLSGNTEAALVPAGSIVEIKWKYLPQNTALRLQEWHGGTHNWKFVRGNRFQLPDEAGLYLYNMHVEWGRGQATGSYTLFLDLY